MEVAEVVPNGAQYGRAYHERIEERLARLEATVERLEYTVRRIERLEPEKTKALTSAWRKEVSEWIQAEHEQVELHATMLLGLAGLTAIAQRSSLPEPPTWPPPS